MSSFTREEETALLASARFAIRDNLSQEIPEYPVNLPNLEIKRGCFVTLHKRGRLRGCIGTIEPIFPLAEAVKKNACSAAFSDPRFPAVSADELADIDIEISVLTVPRKIDFNGAEDLKKHLKPGVHGVILSQGHRSATFLPQVWEQLPGKEQFLENLCIKGGLPPTAWKDSRTVVKLYKAEYFSE